MWDNTHLLGFALHWDHLPLLPYFHYLTITVINRGGRNIQHKMSGASDNIAICLRSASLTCSSKFFPTCAGSSKPTVPWHNCVSTSLEVTLLVIWGIFNTAAAPCIQYLCTLIHNTHSKIFFLKKGPHLKHTYEMHVWTVRFSVA